MRTAVGSLEATVSEAGVALEASPLQLPGSLCLPIPPLPPAALLRPSVATQLWLQGNQVPGPGPEVLSAARRKPTPEPNHLLSCEGLPRRGTQRSRHAPCQGAGGPQSPAGGHGGESPWSLLSQGRQHCTQCAQPLPLLLWGGFGVFSPSLRACPTQKHSALGIRLPTQPSQGTARAWAWVVPTWWMPRPQSYCALSPASKTGAGRAA